MSREKLSSKEFYVFLMCKFYIRRLQIYLAAFSYMVCASRLPPQLKKFEFLSHEAHLEDQKEVLVEKMMHSSKQRVQTEVKTTPKKRKLSEKADSLPARSVLLTKSKKAKIVSYKLCRIKKHVYKPMFH